MSDVLKLHRRQFTVAEIAERLGLTASEVTRQIVAERNRRAVGADDRDFLLHYGGHFDY
jgi:hypothetical protein